MRRILQRTYLASCLMLPTLQPVKAHDLLAEQVESVVSWNSTNAVDLVTPVSLHCNARIHALCTLQLKVRWTKRTAAEIT